MTKEQKRIFRNSDLGRLTFEQLGVEDGQRVSFHIRQQHGYVMPEPPQHTEQFRALIRSGKYVSLLAENDHRQVLGHIALEEHEWFGGLNEICNLVIKPMARGLGLAGKLCDATIEIAANERRGNLYAIPVLHHPISQRVLNKAGLVPCGLNANIMDMRRILGHEDEDGKLSVVLCVKVGRDISSVPSQLDSRYALPEPEV